MSDYQKLLQKYNELKNDKSEVIQLIKSNADAEYRPNLSKDIPIEEQNLRSETYSILAWIANKYWGEEINKIEEEHHTEESEDISLNMEEKTVENNLPIEISNISWYQKVKNKILQILKIIFKRKEKNVEEGVNNETSFTRES